MNLRKLVVVAAGLAGAVSVASPVIAGSPPPLPPAIPDYSDGVGSIWPYGDFWNVPQLGTEPVRGSGCGASGEIGDVIPDGLWAGFVRGYTLAETDAVEVDLLCVYDSVNGPDVDAQAAIGVAEAAGSVVVDDDDRVRSMPSALQAIVLGEYSADASCIEGTHLSPEATAVIAVNTERPAWIRIDQGAVTWVYYGCAHLAELDPPAPTPTTAPSTTVAPPTTAAPTTAAPSTTAPPPATTAPPTTPAPPAEGTFQRIEFASGASGATVGGAVARGTTNRYVLWAGANQTMSVSIASVEGNARFSLVAPDGLLIAFDEVSTEVVLPADGDYVIEVGTDRGSAEYTLDVAVY